MKELKNQSVEAMSKVSQKSNKIVTYVKKKRDQQVKRIKGIAGRTLETTLNRKVTIIPDLMHILNNYTTHFETI